MNKDKQIADLQHELKLALDSNVDIVNANKKLLEENEKMREEIYNYACIVAALQTQLEENDG
jgi:hypothetical protein